MKETKYLLKFVEKANVYRQSNYLDPFNCGSSLIIQLVQQNNYTENMNTDNVHPFKMKYIAIVVHLNDIN